MSPPAERHRPIKRWRRAPTPQERQALTDLFQRLSEDQRPSAVDVAKLSDLSRHLVAVCRECWFAVPVARRRTLVSLMDQLAECNAELDFRRVFEVALEDPDPTVRAGAVTGLWEADDWATLERLLDLLSHEEVVLVREAIVVALSRFSYRAATEPNDDVRCRRLRDTLITLAREDPALSVRRRAVEAIGYFGDDPVAVDLISEAYEAEHHELRVSAIHAMGRTVDRRWLPYLLAELTSDEPELRYEAATACGALGAPEAVDLLLELTEDPDREVQAAAIHALGEIGSTLAANALRRLARSTDPVVRDAAVEALKHVLYDTDPLRASPWP
mgnify:CR=1 FL=1